MLKTDVCEASLRMRSAMKYKNKIYVFENCHVVVFISVKAITTSIVVAMILE